MPLVQFIIAVVVFVVGALLRKGPPDAEPANFEDFGFPDVDPSKRIPIIWGKKRLSGLHTMDVQDFRTDRIRRGNFISGRTTVGFEYYATVQLGICRGPGVTVTKILLDNKTLWEGTAPPTDDGFVINIDDDEFFGSAGGVDDGVKGTIRIYGGGPTQNINTRLATSHAAEGLPTPAYRHMCHAVFENFYWGNQPAVRQLEFVCERYPDTLGLGNDRFVSTTPNISPTEGAVDISLMEIAHEMLTSVDFGLGEDAGDIDVASLTAAASTLEGENNAASLVWVRGDSIQEVLRIIMQQANGFIFKRLDTGQWEVNLARDIYSGDVSPLNNGLIALEINEDNASLRNYSRGSWDETLNMVRVNWQDRNLKNRPQPADAQDMANFDIQGDIQLQSYTLPGVHSAELAAKMAGRFLKETAFPLSIAEVVVDRSAFLINPGDVIRFSWQSLGIQQIFMRVVRIGYGEVDQAEIQLSLVQDIFGLAQTSFGFPQNSLGTPQNPDPTQITDAYVIDMGPWTGRQDADNILTQPKPLTLVAAPQGNSLQYTPFSRIGAAGAFAEEDASAPFARFGTLQSDLNPEDVHRTEEEYATIVIENVNDVVGLDDTVTYTDAEVRQGFGMIVIESEDPASPPIGSPQFPASPRGDLSVPEYMSYRSLSIAGNTVTLSDVSYGMDDTVPRRHFAGARVWFVTGFIGTTLSVFSEGDDVNLRFRNETTAGNADIDAATIFTREMRNRMNRPIVPGRVALAPKADGPTSPTAIQGFWPWPAFVFPQGAIRVRWARRNRKETLTWLQKDPATNVHLDQSPQYNVEVEVWRGNPGLETLLRREAWDDVSAGDASVNSWDYTKAMQVADGGPYNNYIFILRSYEGVESPRMQDVKSIVEQRRQVRYDPVFSSPIGLVSPLSPTPIFPPSPVSPRYGSPVVSPLSPIHSPLSPVPSPTSPFPFLSPRSPLLAPSPIPSPVPAFAAMVRAIGPGGPQGWWSYDELTSKKFLENPQLINKGTYGTVGNIAPDVPTEVPGIPNVKGRDGHQNAYRYPGYNPDLGHFHNHDQSIKGGTQGGWGNLSSPRAETGAFFLAFRGLPQFYNPALDASTHDASDYAIFGFGTGNINTGITVSATSVALGNSPADSPGGRNLKVTIQGTSSSRRLVFYFATVPPVMDGEFHTFALTRPTRGAVSPDYPFFYFDGVRHTPTLVRAAGGVPNVGDAWFDTFQATFSDMIIGSSDSITKFGVDMDEVIVWDNYTPTDEEMEFLHASYKQEDLFSLSPLESRLNRTSPFPSPKQAWSPNPSPMSPDEDYWNLRRIIEKVDPLILWDFSTVGPGSPIMHNDGNSAYNYRLQPIGGGVDGANTPSPIWDRSPMHRGLQVMQGQGADGSISPSMWVRFPESPALAFAGNFEDNSNAFPSPKDFSPSELKHWSPDAGSVVLAFRIPPTSPRNETGGYIASFEYSGSNWGWSILHSSSSVNSTLRIEWYTSTGSSSDMAITTPSDRRMDDNRWHLLLITKPRGYAPGGSPITRKAEALEMYLDGEMVDYGSDSSQIEYWFNTLTLVQPNMIFAVGARGLATSSNEIQSAPGVDLQYFALTRGRIDRRVARWMWGAFSKGHPSPRQSPHKSPASPVPSPLSPVQSPISPLPSPISPWTAISPHSPLGSPINPSPVPPFEDIQALSDLLLEYTFNTDTISPRVVANTGSMGSKADLIATAGSRSPLDYTIGVGGDQSASPTQAFNFTGSPSQNLLYRTLDASPNPSVVFDLDRGCITLAFRAESGQDIPVQGANLFAIHVASNEYFRCYLQSDGKLQGYWRPLASSSFERRLRSDNDMRDDRWHIVHFNFLNVLSFGGDQSPEYGRMYIDGKYQNETLHTVDAGGRTRWLSDIDIINTLMVGAWDLTAPPDDFSREKAAFKGDIDYISVSTLPMREVWIEGAASSYHKGRLSPFESPI